MSDVNNRDHEFFEQLNRDHEHLRSLLGEIRWEFSKQDQSVAKIVQLINSLSEAVAIHFREEENSGCYEQIQALSPHATEQLQRLRIEHSELLLDVRTMVESAANGGGSPEWRRLEKEFGDFSRQLMIHESVENDLLQRAFDEDIGSND